MCIYKQNGINTIEVERTLNSTTFTETAKHSLKEAF